MQDSVLTIRVPEDLRRSFSAVAKQQGLTASLVLRKLMEQYLHDNAQIDIFRKGAKK